MMKKDTTFLKDFPLTVVDSKDAECQAVESHLYNRSVKEGFKSHAHS